MHVNPQVESRKSYDEREQSGYRSEEDKADSETGLLDLLGSLGDRTSLEFVNVATDLGELPVEVYSQKAQ